MLNGKIPPSDVAVGLLMQCLWIGLCLLFSNYLWRQGSKRYVAVGG